ncbi:hopanoid biosynthesis-associated protein HpnK [Kovacikia minuta CCNUW1]|uniref:hopanoid biosynthesis-associated protein HpnK n=1 Tax=Kovacikia minuta TaxID=2931930 RepID=UPI001CCF9BAF|nr:hopanoid biosynthesis-associated protein HpnK [Kovacikia minuta]UBF28041.1 hopanoid biosynthesis-associated protein HpnK [Kovacikia minuta CCNUW1]
MSYSQAQTKFSTDSPGSGSSARSHRRFAIINADDFGFSHGVNRAIIAAHERGVLTSTSLMVGAPAFEEAVELAKAHPKLGVGLHLTLGKGKSVLPPSLIPNLVDDEGNFSNEPNRAGVYYQFNGFARRQIPLEIRAQLEKFRSTGLKLSHVDGHLHMHSHPVILRSLVALAEEFDIKVIRLPSEELRLTLNIDRSDLQTKVVWASVFWGLRLYGEKVLQSKGIGFVDRVYGFLQSARMTEDYLLALIPQIQADVVEIYSHPAIANPDEPVNSPIGWGQRELEALTSDRVRAALAESNFELVNFNDWETITSA